MKNLVFHSLLRLKDNHGFQGPVPQSPISPLSYQSVSEYETYSLPKRLHRNGLNVENQTNGPSFSSLNIVQVAGSRIKLPNFTNPGLA